MAGGVATIAPEVWAFWYKINLILNLLPSRVKPILNLSIGEYSMDIQWGV